MVIILAAGCTHKALRPSGDQGKQAKSDGSYDYLLTEALRLKYVGDVNDAARLFEKCIEID
ncbi:MAG: hypothetical protein ABR531_05580, partial [Bacteroidales bacterium]